MCGICGVTGTTAQTEKSLESVIDLLELRGPDDKGRVTFESIALGHTRLAIQDEKFGAQPMQSATKNHTVVFNGEIYNHFELRESLPNFPWRSNSDTETVVELIEAYGQDVISKFVGMYALGIWNANNSELILARDLFGEKPLYYSTNGTAIAFSSDPRGLPILLGRVNDVNPTSLPYFLKYGYINSEDATQSHVSMLLPGQMLFWKDQNLRIDTPHKSMSSTRDFSHKVLRAKLENAVKRTLIADEKVGVMLSGGLDSSIIAAFASKECNKLPTYTVALNPNSEDSKYAKELAKELKTEHCEIVVNERELAEEIEYILSNLAQPFGDSAIIPTYLLSKIASRDVKVLLSGDGADEVFAGYGYYDKYRNLDNTMTWKPESYLRQIRYEISKNSRSKRINKNREDFRKSLLSSGRISVEDSWSQDLAAFSDSELTRMFKTKLTKIEKGKFDSSEIESPFWRVLDADRRTYLAGDILRKGDMGGMLASVEIRAPYLDKDLSRYLNDSIKKPSELNKKILFEACGDLIPRSIFERKKQGFGAPLDQWLSYSEVNSLVMGILANPKSKIYEYFDFESSMTCIKASNLKKWNFFSLAIWLQKNG
jgi:asparagine synthase (glutamine-hydrolysing)